MNILTQLQWRYATKQFDKTKHIDSATLKKITDSLVLTPSSFGLQPWKFIVISEPTLKESLLPHSWNQPQITDCSHLIVLMAKEHVTKEDIDLFLDDSVAKRGGSRDDLKDYEGMMNGFINRMSEDAKFNWAKNQVYIALGQLLTTAALLEVDACPLEGISPQDYDSVLGIEGYKTVLACALGYRLDGDKYADLEKIRFSSDTIIEHR